MTLHADLSIQFLPAPVILVVEPDTGSVINAEDRLIINFTDSYTMDGILFTDSYTFNMGGGEELEWEWQWECVVPEGWEGEGGGGRGGRCEYESGREIRMPGEGEWVFVGEEGEDLKKEMPLYFIVGVRVRERGGGEVVGEGKWERVYSPVEGGVAGDVGVVVDKWGCGGGKEGYSVCVFYFYWFSFYCSPFHSPFFLIIKID